MIDSGCVVVFDLLFSFHRFCSCCFINRISLKKKDDRNVLNLLFLFEKMMHMLQYKCLKAERKLNSALQPGTQK